MLLQQYTANTLKQAAVRVRPTLYVCIFCITCVVSMRLCTNGTSDQRGTRVVGYLDILIFHFFCRSQTRILFRIIIRKLQELYSRKIIRMDLVLNLKNMHFIVRMFVSYVLVLVPNSKWCACSLSTHSTWLVSSAPGARADSSQRDPAPVLWCVMCGRTTKQVAVRGRQGPPKENKNRKEKPPRKNRNGKEENERTEKNNFDFFGKEVPGTKEK